MIGAICYRSLLTHYVRGIIVFCQGDWLCDSRLIQRLGYVAVQCLRGFHHKQGQSESTRANACAGACEGPVLRLRDEGCCHSRRAAASL